MPENKKMEPPSDSKTGTGITIKKELPSVSMLNMSTIKDLKASLGVNRLGSTSRLPSFKGPRDLTLSTLATSSGIQPQLARTKKTFVPNIPIRREKGDSKVIESRSERSTKKTHAKPQGGSHGRGRGRELVQTRGALFGEGIAAAPLKRGFNSYSGHDGKGSSGSKIGEMQKPVLNTEVAYNIDKDLEDKRLKEILRDDFIDDPDDATSINFLPVQLPMISLADSTVKGGVSNLKMKEKWKCRASCEGTQADPQLGLLPKMGIKIKQEPGEEPENEKEEKRNGFLYAGQPSSEQESFEDSVAYLLSKLQSDIMFFQLPSCLPGHPPEVNMETNPTTSSTQSQVASKDSNIQRDPVCTLDTLPEGKIGSLKVYESGKVELCLGNYNMELNRGTSVGFLQDVVRMEVDNEQKTGSMVVLGHIKNRLVCTPDFHNLTNNLSTS